MYGLEDLLYKAVKAGYCPQEMSKSEHCLTTVISRKIYLRWFLF